MAWKYEPRPPAGIPPPAAACGVQCQTRERVPPIVKSHTKVALLNLLSVGAALGVITLVFQHGVLGGALGIEPRARKRESVDMAESRGVLNEKWVLVGPEAVAGAAQYRRWMRRLPR